MADDNEMNGDEVGWWSCSLCTYKNSADKFKCEICDLRRGTSTRKPRCSADTIVAQVVKQQEQIRQQTKVKPTPKNKSGGTGPRDPQSASSSNNNNNNSNNNNNNNDDSIGTSGTSSRPIKKSSSKRKLEYANARRSRTNDDLTSDEDSVTERSYPISSSSDEFETSGRRGEDRKLHAKKKKKMTMKKKVVKGKDRPATKKSKKSKLPAAKASTNPDDSESGTSSATEDSLAYLEMDSATPLSSQSSGFHLRMMSGSPDSSQSSERNLRMMSATPDSLTSPEPSTSSPPPDHQSSARHNGDGHSTKDNPFKIRPIELNGNLIKYLPPTSTGRTGLIIDKKRFTQHSVTVDDVTITFTEFATRQNNYIRKSKKKSSKSLNRPSTTGKTQSKTGSSHSNNNSPLPATAKSHDRASVTND